MVALGAEAQHAVRVAQGLPDQLRLVTSSVFAEFIAAPLTDAFAGRLGRQVEASAGVAVSTEMPVLIANRLADVALGPNLAARGAGQAGRPGTGLISEPVFKYKLVTVTSPRSRPHGSPRDWTWLVDPSGTDPGSDVSALLRRLDVPESRISVFPNQTAAWAAAADGTGVAPAIGHLVSHQLRRGELRMADGIAPLEGAWYATTLPRDRRPGVAGSLRHFLGTPEAMQLMREPRGGVPVSRFRPPVYVTIWS
jgi:LysR family transcriptional regulator, low CO2-responsive transcriptional regulator